MIKGTTPTHTFNIPFDTSLIDEVRVVYSQNDTPLLTKTTEDCIMVEQTISVTLTQEDTFLFDNKPVDIQLRVLTKAGEALASVPERVGIVRCLEDGVVI